jgi:hypothetical protein
MLFVDGGNNRVGVGTASPNAGLELNLASGDGLLINSADVGTIKMKTTGGSVKNWGFAHTNLAAGDFGIYESNSNGGDPITAGAAKLYFNAAGAATFSSGITALSANINGQLNVTGTTNSNNIYAQQLSTQFDTSSFLRLHPTSTTDNGGFTNIFFGTSTANNYGVAIGGKRGGGNPEPSFAVRMLNDSTVGTEVLKITNAGHVTTPYQPSWGARGLSNNQSGSGTTGTNETLVFSSATNNTGNHYSTSTGIFTAPVAGRYFVTFSGLYNISDNTTGPVYIRHNSTEKYRAYHQGSGSNYEQIAVSGVVDVAANDTISMFSVIDGWHVGGETSFSGYLIG